MDRILRPAVNGLCFLGIALLGCALSVALYHVWQIEARWGFVVVVAIAAVAVSMCLVRIFSKFLLVVLLFSLPFVALGSKWLALSDVKWYAGFFGVSLIDFILIGLYMSWFYRVFVTREQSPQGFNRLDFFVLWYIVAHLVATIGCADARLGFGATEYLGKYVLFYFYLSRHLDERYLLWMLAALAFTIALEAAIATLQFTTGGLLGLALQKGADVGTSSNPQYDVPGTEGYNRAIGTTTDSHTLGHLLGLILPFPAVLSLTPGLRPGLRLGAVALVGAALLAILFSLSRSAWLAVAIALPIGIVLMIVFWRERHMVPAIAVAAVLVVLFAPLVGAYVYERFAGSPVDTLLVRFNMFYVAWRALLEHPLFGIGPGNWYAVFDRYDYLWQPVEQIHNVVLTTAVELGVFGLAAYFGMMGTVMLRFFGLARRRRDITGRLALAGLIAMMVTLLDGMADPFFREPIVFMMFWILVVLAVALPRLPPGAFGVLMAPPKPAGGPAAALGMVPGGGVG